MTRYDDTTYLMPARGTPLGLRDVFTGWIVGAVAVIALIAAAEIVAACEGILTAPRSTPVAVEIPADRPVIDLFS